MGLITNDQFFGKTETYRRDLRIRLPVDDASGLDRFKLKVTSQGCADIGVCYVPHEQIAEIRLAAAPVDTLVSDPLTRLGIENKKQSESQRAEGSFSDRGTQGLIGGDESRFVQVLESGRIWATWTASNGAGGRQTLVTHSDPSGGSFTTPFVLPVAITRQSYGNRPPSAVCTTFASNATPVTWATRKRTLGEPRKTVRTG